MVKYFQKTKKTSKTNKKQKKPNKIKKPKKEEKKGNALDKLNEIRKFYVNKKQAQMTQLQALKYLKSMAEKYDSDKKGIPFSEYLEDRCKKSEKINQIVEISRIFKYDNAYSLTNYLEDNDFSEKDLSDKDPNYDNKNKISTKSTIQNINSNGPLKGKTIVLTGEMMVNKDDLKLILMNLGAKVTSAVSPKTDILIHGEFLEDGRNYTDGKKYKTAKENQKEIYSDREFEKYMQKLLKHKWNMKKEAEKTKKM